MRRRAAEAEGAADAAEAAGSASAGAAAQCVRIAEGGRCRSLCVRVVVLQVPGCGSQIFRFLINTTQISTLTTFNRIAFGMPVL